MKRILRLILFIFLIFDISNLSLARRTKVVQDFYWELDYTINKYGENDKIIGAYCGQYGLSNKIYVNKYGMIISFGKDYRKSKVSNIPVKISFLFNSTNEIIIDSAVQILSDEYVHSKEFFISKQNLNYQKLINNIMNSNYMSIVVESNGEIIDRMVKIDNRYSKEVLTQLQNSIPKNEKNDYFEELKKNNVPIFEAILRETFSTMCGDIVYDVEISSISDYAICVNIITNNGWEQLNINQKIKLKEKITEAVKELAVSTNQAINQVNVQVIFLDKNRNKILGI